MADSQLRKGVVELIVLAALSTEPAYGGQLIARLVGLHFEVSPGTLYPLLTRLKKAGYIEHHWEESPSGPPRKVYSVTAQGSAYATTLAKEWHQLSSTVNHLLKGLDS